jgi:peptide/nickel transport system ATP-binding protein
MDSHFLEVRNLKKYFKRTRGNVHAVDGVNFTIDKGKTLGVVGESGCGKSTLGRCVLRLIEPTDGEVLYEGRDICKLNKRELKDLRKEMQIIFQDPFSSLNPRKTVLDLIAEPIKFNKLIPNASKADIENRVLELMETVGIAERLINTYPHELDGGCPRSTFRYRRRSSTF